MHIIFLRFGPNRAQASQWMAGHMQWIQQGLDDGSFLMAGSLDSSQGGLVLARGLDTEEIRRRVALDPFVIHGVVQAEVHRVTPSRLSTGMAALLEPQAVQ
ncbi:YciI family protein [Massilia endophytica]|uniref:YciI family protein n=1 Tax=Massilia endophytica TaxID=2899220 RepID=UPI001E361A74|nr:hypothetical protein [Massilia endophytica]UGQ48787.1 hypothetical protein LSQ66_10095 [Massilia endophytica]